MALCYDGRMHSWQDMVLSIGSLIFVVALLPSIFSPHKPSFSTSASTGAVLIVFGFTYISLNLWYAATTTFLSGVLWAILAVQKALQK